MLRNEASAGGDCKVHRFFAMLRMTKRVYTSLLGMGGHTMISLFKKSQFGFSSSIKLFFLALVQPLISFSLAIA
jgi:hypothetical protein